MRPRRYAAEYGAGVRRGLDAGDSFNEAAALRRGVQMAGSTRADLESRFNEAAALRRGVPQLLGKQGAVFRVLQ